MAAKKKKKQQTEIPGTERAIHADVVSAAEELFAVREERMALTQEESKLANKLIDLMKKHGIDEYTDDDMTVTLVVAVEKVKVKKRPEPGQDDE